MTSWKRGSQTGEPPPAQNHIKNHIELRIGRKKCRNNRIREKERDEKGKK